LHYLDMQNFFDIKLIETFYSKCWLSFNIKVEVILREYSKFLLILKKNLDYMFLDATAYNNSGYCHGDNYRLTCWCTTLIRVKWFRSRHDMASVYLIAVRCASLRRLIYKNAVFSIQMMKPIHRSLSPFATVVAGKTMFTIKKSVQFVT